MYELSRVLLRAIGPEAARYEDVLLDFGGAGNAFRALPDTLFDEASTVRRPSPASVLQLQNGGGKSVLIKLIFSVVLPGRRKTIGTTNTHTLDSFVLEGDVSHVALEWVHARSGRRLVTGKVASWRNGRPSADSDQLVQRWYHFRPTENHGLRDLPIVHEGRYRPLSEFCELMQAASDADPEMEYALFRRHGEWTDRLADLGLDPVLFDYQRAMNADEGDAADAFSFGTDSAFVNFLLRVVVPPKPPEDLAALVNTYADKLSDRSDLEREREFVEGCLTSLEPLAQARSEWLQAAEQREEEAGRLNDVLRRIHVRAVREDERLALLKEEANRLRDDCRRAADHHLRLKAVVTELRRITAQMRLAEAEAEEAAQRDIAETAELVDLAWQAVPKVLTYQDAVVEDRRLSLTIAAAHEAARPALIARDTAARRLLGALTALREQALRTAADKEAEAEERVRLAEESQSARDSSFVAAAAHTAEAGLKRREIEAIEEEVRTAVREGHLPDGLPVHQAVEEARESLAEAKSRTVELEALLDQAQTDLGEATTERIRRAKETAEAKELLRAARNEYEKAQGRTTALASDPGFIGLLGPDPVDLESDAGALLVRLAEVRQEADSRRAEINVLMAGDERARTALETTELLPPSVEATRARQALEDAGIPAWTGWDYLAAVSDVTRRKELVDAAPGIASGVVINSSEQFEEARRVLVGKKLWPLSYVAVGTKAHLMSPPPDNTDMPFAIPAHPALYDERAAAEELARLKHRHDLHRQQLRDATDHLDSASRLESRLKQWREDCPPGHLARLHARVDEQLAALEEAEERLASVVETCERHELERARIKAAVPQQRAEEERRAKVLGVLERLAVRANLLPSLQAEEGTALREATEERAAAACHGDLSKARRDEAAALFRTADAMKNTVERLRSEITELPPLEPLAGVGPADAGVSLPALRRAYEAAADEYRRVSVGEDLKAKAALARDRLKAAEKEVTELPPTVHEVAERLLASPEGADGASRSLAREAARRALVASRELLAELSSTAQARRVDLEPFSDPSEPVDLTPYAPPAHLGAALRVLSEAEQDRQGAERAWQELTHHVERAEQKCESARHSSTAFRHLTQVLGPGTGPEPASDEAGFDGDVEAARRRHDVIHAAHEQAKDVAEKARRKERTQADKLASHAAHQRFAHLKLPSREIILGTPRSELPDKAAQWEKALRQRLSSLEVDLNAIDRHRRSIVRQLAQQVEEALKTLRRAERLSRLPEGLGDWSGETFLQIGFTAPKGDTLIDRLAVVLDEVSAEVVAGRALQRDGIALLLRGVAAAVGTRGFRVRILKPEAVLRKTRVPVSQLKDVFSGGQVLTTAIVLYCTMAALRANEKGRSTDRLSGVLFLDNPIGRASATYLLRLQQAVAKALGVQLIFTTGLEDLTVLENFPLVVRMRNEADLRAHRHYLRVHETMRGLLDSSLSVEDENRAHSTVSTARYYRRPLPESENVHE
ncbi:hypothetical protein [Streptomyces sp. CC208A]|uniref:hypothetical protein n=1 Tax=Streptomyces sp. CC208A TaxID=3044573 RepID=UPI0024A8C9E7|nr:hypothetical protein [Streptomyces sp. CC208A]